MSAVQSRRKYILSPTILLPSSLTPRFGHCIALVKLFTQVLNVGFMVKAKHKLATDADSTALFEKCILITHQNDSMTELH